MRIDSINLLGNFYIKGVTASANTSIGLSGSQITWVNVNASGGGSTGPQGPAGPTFSATGKLGEYEIAIGTGTNVNFTSSDYYWFLDFDGKDCATLGLGACVKDLGGSTFSSVLMSASYSVCKNLNSMIVSSFCVGSFVSNYSAIISNCKNSNLVCSRNSLIISGKQNQIQNFYYNNATKYIVNLNYASIIGGYQNQIKSCDNNTILGGKQNFINILGCNSAIVGGCGNKLCAPNLDNPSGPPIGGGNNNVILGGDSNCLSGDNSVIVGGCRNCIGMGVTNSAIIGSYCTGLFYSQQSVILGVSNATFSNFLNTTIVENMKVKSFTRLTHNSPNVCNGDLWFDTVSSKLMFRKNDTSYYISCN